MHVSNFDILNSFLSLITQFFRVVILTVFPDNLDLVFNLSPLILTVCVIVSHYLITVTRPYPQ